MKGVEFYDCLFFYLTRFLKGRAAGQTPRRNLAEFLEEYLVRFKDGDKWLYRVPTPPRRKPSESLDKRVLVAAFGNMWPTFGVKVTSL